jgi:hypothetical protein
MKGTRLADGFACTVLELEVMGVKTTPSATYWKTERGTFDCVTPNGRHGNLAAHTVIEHEDGTITVSPSILIYAREGRHYDADERLRLVAMCGEDNVQDFERGRPAWHGYLEAGVWREC